MSAIKRNPWIAILNKLPLSRTEKAVVQRFVADPGGRSFLALSDILRSHRKSQEALELLMQGVQDHPQFLVARVVLAREYFHQGMVAEAWQSLVETPAPLHDNVLAQKLKLKLAVLMRDDSAFQECYRHMQKHQMLDHDCRELVKTYENEGIAVASQSLQAELRQKGVELWVPDVVVKDPEVNHSPAEESTAPLHSNPGDVVLGDVGSPVEAKEFAVRLSHGSTSQQPAFHVMSLAEVFQGGDDKGWSVKTVGGIELDSTTLGEIYARQGHFTKALAVYKRLLHVNPGSEMLRARVSELHRLDAEQRNEDNGVDPELLDALESTDQLDRKIKYYQNLMDRLGT